MEEYKYVNCICGKRVELKLQDDYGTKYKGICTEYHDEEYGPVEITLSFSSYREDE